MVIYNSGADRNHASEEDQKKASMPILRKSMKEVRVANDATTKEKHESELLFAHLPPESRETTSFEEFSHSLISVGKIATSDSS